MVQSTNQDAREAISELGFSIEHGVQWDDYIKYRPLYPASFFRRIYHYHEAKPKAALSVAHDVGAGCGIVSAHLSEVFGHVVVSDPNDGYTTLAREILTKICKDPGSAGEKFTFLKEAAEKSILQSETVDLITACECIHWTDAVASLQEFRRQLKPGGTLAVAHYSVPQIIGNAAAQDAWMVLWAYHSSRAPGLLYDRAFQLCNTAMDGLDFPSSDWTSVKRVYINADSSTVAFAFNERIGESRVKEGEERIWHGVDKDWCSTQDIDWLKGFFGTFTPKIPEDEIPELWDALDKVLKGDRVQVRVPLVMLLATKI